MFSPLRFLRSCTVILALLHATTVARADVVYENLGPNDEFDKGSGWIVGLGFPLFDVGESFRVRNQSYTLDTIQVPIGLVVGENEFFIHLQGDDNGKPGKVMESFHLINAMEMSFDITAPIVIESQEHPVLQRGARYWVVASATVETFAVWRINSIGDVGPHGQRKDFGEWEITRKKRAAFRVTGIPLGGDGK